MNKLMEYMQLILVNSNITIFITSKDFPYFCFL